jgi:hypothetical protein
VQEAARVAVTFQHREVRDRELAGDGVVDGRHDLPGQFPDAHLVAGRQFGEPVRGAHPAVQVRGVALGQRERLQPVGVDNREACEGERVDHVRLRMLRQEPP